MKEAAAEWRKANPDARRDHKRNYREQNREKVRAHEAVCAAVASGRLTRQPCEVCGNADVQAHHDDYAKPLEVRWLCVPHHVEADRARRARLAASRLNAAAADAGRACRRILAAAKGAL